MPRLTEHSRRARRDDIAQAALRVLAREGVAGTSIAHIVEESGGSSGAIYAHFASKAELALYIADHFLDWRMDEVAELAAGGRAPAPAQVMARILSAHGEDAPPLGVVLQFWAEATTDADLHALLSAKMTALRDAFEAAITAWARARGVDSHRTAAAMVALCQGWLVNTGLVGWLTPDEYLDAATAALAPSRSDRSRSRPRRPSEP